MPDPRNGDDVRGDLVVEVAVALTRDHDQAVRRERGVGDLLGSCRCNRRYWGILSTI